MSSDLGSLGCVLVFYLGCAFLCASIANSKGRSGLGWFLAALFFPVIALVAVCVSSDLKKLETIQNELRQMRRELDRNRLEGH